MRSKICLPYGLGYGLGLSGLVLAGACAHNPAAETGVYVTSRPLVLSPDGRGEAVALSESEPLRPGQVFTLDLQLAAPAHVYVVHRRGLLVGTLYPGVGQADVELSAGTVRVPGQDTYMRVPELDRQTHLCVLLSAEVLPAAKRRCPDGRNPHPGRPRVQSFPLPARNP